MSIEKSTPDELIVQFREKYQSIINENQQLAQKIKENETIALKLLGAIETLEYLQTNTEEQEVDTVEE
jgi:hypothetical protein